MSPPPLFALRLSDGDRERLAAVSEAMERSMSWIVRAAIREYLTRHEHPVAQPQEKERHDG